MPMWVIKTHGVTFYVNHVTAEIPWTTKETPDNEHTKGSLKFKRCRLSIDEDNCATLSKLRLVDKLLPTPHRVVARIIAPRDDEFHNALKRMEFKHSKIKYITGMCSNGFIVCDLLDESEVTFAGLKYHDEFRILNSNEQYYKAYDESDGYIDIDYSEADTPYEWS